MGIFGTSSPFDQDVERATSENNTSEEWGLILEICDRAGASATNSRDCLRAVMRRLAHPDPHVQVHAATLLDACISNCGKIFHLEVASREFEMEFRRLLSRAQPAVSQKLMSLLRKWAEGEFRNDPQLDLIPSLHNKLCSELGEKTSVPTTEAQQATKDAAAQREQEELARAIALSLREANTSTSPSTALYPKVEATDAPAPTPTPARKVRALYDFEAAEDNELTFMAGEIDGIVVVDDEYVRGRKVFAQVVCTFRYGREEDEVMGVNFHKELYLASDQIYPAPEKRSYDLTRTQERLMKKLGETALPFRLSVPAGSPGSVTLQPGLEDEGEPCGVHYYIKLFVGDTEIDRSHRRSTVALGIRKVQYAPNKPGPQPCTVVRKDFMLSPGQLELELTLDKQLYIHGETIAINISVRNHSNKVVKKIKACILQSVDVVLFQNGQYRNVVCSVETQDGCPLQPGASMQKVVQLRPELSTLRDRRGLALDAQLKRHDNSLASTTLLLEPEQRDAFGIIVSYSAKVKLYLGALNGELSAELPFILMHPKEGRAKLVQADSQADVEMFRQDTVHHQESIDVY